jgi:hypothetical protein
MSKKKPLMIEIEGTDTSLHLKRQKRKVKNTREMVQMV